MIRMSIGEFGGRLFLVLFVLSVIFMALLYIALKDGEKEE